ncbi:MAG: HAMP domain-containing histidine kinase [Alistipes sp.]|nr:HAMP domain-containing histidine kinase [Alistipes sp.]
MNKFKFRITTLIIILLLAGMAALQTVSLRNMYDERMRDFERKVVSAMQRSAYEELTIRRNQIKLQQTMRLNADSLSAFISEAVDSAMLQLNELSNLDSLLQLNELSSLDSLLQASFATLSQSGSIVTSGVPINAGSNINMDISVDTTSNTVMRKTTMRRSPTKMRSPSNTKRQFDTIVYTPGSTTANAFIYGSNAADYTFIPIPNITIPSINIRQDIEPSRLDFDILSSCLSNNLAHMGITQDWRMTVDDDSFGVEHVDGGLRYSIPINVKRDSQSEYVVEIANPNKRFLKEMRWLIISAAVIVLLIAAVCFYLQYALFRQKSLARIKADFTHNITHELKTPIAVAYAANDALSNFNADDDPDKRKRYLSVVGNQLSLLSAMVERILTMSIEERDDFRLSPSECDAEEMFSQQREQFLLKAGKPTTITIGVMPQPLRFRADRLHLGNIIGNLIDNAIKYSGDSVDISLSASLDGRWVVISVEDNGIGIPQSSIGHIFDKFYRVPTGERHDVKGFGLGLYYVKLIVGKHGGTISVRSRVGKGTTFTIKLPYDGR